MPNFALLTLSHHLFACNELPAIPTPCLVWFAITKDLNQMVEIYMSCVFGYKMQYMCFVTTAVEDSKQQTPSMSIRNVMSSL